MLPSSRASAPMQEALRSVFRWAKQPLDALNNKVPQPGNGLSWKQWLVLLSMGALIVAIEVYNHTSMWHAHASGQTFWTDRELIWEVFAYGLFMPIIVGLILGHIERTSAERDRVARELDLRRELVRKVSQSQSWLEMAEHLVTVPGEIASAEHAWLLAQRVGTEELEQVAHWNRPGNEVLPSLTSVSSTACARCLQEQAQDRRRLWDCPNPENESGGSRANRYCLRLSTQGKRNAALLFEVPRDQLLGASERNVLEELATEMALAIDKANLYLLEQNQVNIAANERMRIARDLHDTVGQNVTYLRLKLEQLSSAEMASDGTGFQDALANMLFVADETYVQVRDTLEALRTNDVQSVEEAVRQYGAQSGQRGGFAVTVKSSGRTGILSSQQSRQIAYIAREALHNVEKHAAAKNVDIMLQSLESEFSLRVRDDGRGFDPANRDVATGYGLAIMGERARAIDAELLVWSASGQGTEVTVSVPLTKSVAPVAGDE